MPDGSTVEQIQGGVEVEQIDVTQDTNDPVFRASSDDAWMTFIFPSTREHDMIIHTVESTAKGGMKALLDAVCEEYDCSHLRFSTPLSDQLPNALDGFERVVEIVDRGQFAGEKWVCLDGEWNVGEVEP